MERNIMPISLKEFAKSVKAITSKPEKGKKSKQSHPRLGVCTDPNGCWTVPDERTNAINLSRQLLKRVKTTDTFFKFELEGMIPLVKQHEVDPEIFRKYEEAVSWEPFIQFLVNLQMWVLSCTCIPFIIDGVEQYWL